MSKLWNDLKHNMKEWSSAAVEKAEEVSKVAVAKTEELTKISKIKLEVHQLQRDVRRTSEDLGQLVYNQAKDANMVNFTGNTEFFSYIEKIDSLKESISIKQNQIKKINTNVNIKDEDSMEVESLLENNDDVEVKTDEEK
ncbi:MAG: hypothetical protein VX517_05860 [Candidatus Neomarinimicrobiota bacterium]|nr:hypothetical protein [Candidatus Neomarinimicrobiota bacterium]